eukprot:scaffold28816_cov67-Phaeocystis_antarctica.AAC.6
MLPTRGQGWLLGGGGSGVRFGPLGLFGHRVEVVSPAVRGLGLVPRCGQRCPALHLMRGGAADPLVVEDGAPGGSMGGGALVGAGPPSPLESASPAGWWGWLAPACRPRRIALRTDDGGGAVAECRRTNWWTRPRHLQKVDMEAPVAVHTSAFSIVGHATCSSTACSAFTVPNSARFAPSAIARVRATWCASVLVRALCMQWHASSSACSGVGMVCGGVEPHAAWFSTGTMQALCCASSARPVVASASISAVSSVSPHVVISANKLDGDATDSLLLEGGPSGSEGGGESDGVGPPDSLGSVGGYGVHLNSRWLESARRPLRMVLRSSSSSRGRLRRCTS